MFVQVNRSSSKPPCNDSVKAVSLYSACDQSFVTHIISCSIITGAAVHASQQRQQQASMPYVNNHASGQHISGSRLKATIEMSGERISGPQDSAESSAPESNYGEEAAGQGPFDDVELEKSNILMLGPTGELKMA